MTTAELIERLRALDPEGDREVAVYLDPSEDAIGHVKVEPYTGGLVVVIGWDTGPAQKEQRA